jgi:hexulose-6-phosphate isomerase
MYQDPSMTNHHFKKGVYQGCFPVSVDMQLCIKWAKEFDFDGLEISMEDPAPLLPDALDETTAEILAIGESVGMTKHRQGAINLDSPKSHIEEVSQLISASDIEIHSIATMMLFFYPLSSPIPKIREKGCKIVIKMLEAAEILNAEMILIVPGLVTPSVGYLEVYKKSQAVLRDLETEARRMGITMAIENVWNRFLLSPLEMARYIDEIDSPYVGAYFDVANVLTYGYPADWLKILGSRVKGIHFKDFRLDLGNILGFTHLCHGDIDWISTFNALIEIGYKGYVTLEVPPTKTNPLKGVKESKNCLDLILKGMAAG